MSTQDFATASDFQFRHSQMNEWMQLCTLYYRKKQGKKTAKMKCDRSILFSLIKHNLRRFFLCLCYYFEHEMIQCGVYGFHTFENEPKTKQISFSNWRISSHKKRT